MEKKSNRNSLLARVLTGVLSSWATIATVAVAAAAAVLAIAYIGRDTSASLGSDEKIDPTPTLITSMKSIGQWEFMAIADEEIVDTVRHGFFSDDELVRIYYGTLRIGVDLSQASDSWVARDGDSVTVTLPPVKLLDPDFIDEGRTKSFFESGTWSNDDRAALYDRARRAMIARCVTPANLRAAEQNAAGQMSRLMLSLGIKKAGVRFESRQKKQ